MAQAILALSDRVTADSPRDTLSPPTLALHFPGGSIGLQSTVSVGADATNQVVLGGKHIVDGPHRNPRIDGRVCENASGIGGNPGVVGACVFGTGCA